jgi:hypothetical protein
VEEIATYRTVRTPGFTQLDEEVNALIAEGFRPYGNPYAAQGKDGFRVCQAMVKLTTEPLHGPAGFGNQ